MDENFEKTFDKRLTVRLDEERLNQLRNYARSEGYNASLVVRHLVCRFLEQNSRTTVFPKLSLGGE